MIQKKYKVFLEGAAQDKLAALGEVHAFWGKFRAVADEINDEWTRCGAKTLFINILFDKIPSEKAQIAMEIIREKLPHAAVVGTSLFPINDEHSITFDCCFFDNSSVKVFEYNGCPWHYEEYGREIGKSIADMADVKGVLLMCAGVSLNVSEFIDGISENNEDIPFFGAMAGVFTRQANHDVCESIFAKIGVDNEQYIVGNDVYSTGIVTAVFAGKELHIETDVVFGWKPLGKEMPITKTSCGTGVATIDGIPATGIYEKYLGVEPNKRFLENICEFPLVIERNGFEIGRVPPIYDHTGSIYFNGDVRDGETVRLTYGNPPEILRETQKHSEELRRFSPQGVLTYVCGNRYIFLKEDEQKEHNAFLRFAPQLSEVNGSSEIYRYKNKGGILNSALVAVGLREGKKPAALLGEDLQQDEKKADAIPLSTRLATFLDATTRELKASNRELQEMAENAKAAEDKRQKLQAEIKRQSSLLEQQKDSVLRSTQKLEPGCADWDTLTAPGWLPDLCSRLEQALREKENAYAEARVKCSRRKKLQKDKTEKTTEQEILEKKLTEARSEREALERKLHGLQSAVEEIKKQLPYPTEKEARAKLAALTQERNALKTELEAHETALKKAKEDLNLTEGGLKTLQNELPTQEQAAGMAEAALRQVLAENGFADLVAAREALSPIGSADGEEWLQQEKEMLDDHDRELENTCVQIRDLEEQTAGKARIDLTELQTQLAEAKANQSAAADAQKAQSNLLEGHQLVFEKVGVARKVLAGTDRAFKRINRLAELAVGTNSEGGKLSFDRYVMGAIFREVLEMANRRLNIMTGGRFELIHSVDAGRKNAAAGLEIEVLDVTVGKQRASASISGGEGFMVALSLALGLSDVVQNHAGGQRLDTLFIDEGFGTLDDGKLDDVITVLNQLAEGNRLVGIISHVDKLEESIPQKVRVTSTDRGSTLTIELS